jgi:hypothetical protein
MSKLEGKVAIITGGNVERPQYGESTCRVSRRSADARWFKSGHRNQKFCCFNNFPTPATIRIDKKIPRALLRLE